MRRMKIRTKLTVLLLGISTLLVITAGTFSVLTLNRFFRSRIAEELRTQVAEIEFVIRNETIPDSALYGFIQDLAHSGNLRLTMIRSDGSVLFESDLPPGNLPTMENHLHRPEVQAALREGTGTDTRQSATLGLEMFYLARRIDQPFPEINRFHDVSVIRAGIPYTEVRELLGHIRTLIIAASGMALLLIAVVTFIVTKRVASPIGDLGRIAAEIRKGDLSLRLPVRSSDEIGSLAETLNSLIDAMNADIIQLRKLERVRTEFLGNVSHELRTPIFAIQGMLETLLDGALSDPEVNRTFVERSLANTKRLNTLLGDLIEISRIESGEMKMSFRYFPVGELLSQVVTEMRPIADQNRVALTADLTTIGMAVLGDRDRLKQVMINLVDNAIKYNHAGGTVAISAAREDSGVKISVTDNGVGIADDQIPRIFERFYRVDKERSREAGGTGLGLAIVKHIIEAHGSRVSVTSTPGSGSTFSFILRT